ncbi:sigma-70 family RNA polymerase sigma factor [Dyella acidisoli]
MFQHYLPYAKRIASRIYATHGRDGIDYNDFVQLACVGLLESIDRFDPQRGISFKTYCTPRIRGAILNGIDKFGDAREQMSFSKRVRRERLESLTDAESEDSQFTYLSSLATGLAIGFMLDGTGMYFSDKDSPSPYGNSYENAAWEQARLALRRAVATLPEKASKVIRYHYFDLLSFEQIASLLGLSRGRVSQIHRASLEELKKVLQPSHSTTVTG